MKTVDKVFLATSGLLGSLGRFPDNPDGEQNAWQDCYFVVTEAKLMVLKPADKFYSPLNRPHPVESKQLLTPVEIPLNMVNSAFLSRPGWETHIESESDDFFYMLPKEVAEILVIVEARTKARILIGLHKKDAAKCFHRAIVAAKAVQNMLVREPGGLVGMLQREPEAASNIKLKIYGWADNYIKKPTEGQIMLVNRELLQIERCYGVAKDFFALLSELETIKVVDTEFQETDLIELSELVSQLPSRQIQKVTFSRCTFSENAPLRQSFGALGNCQRIEEIAFDGCDLSDADLPELKNLWLLVPTLKILRLTRNNKITGEYYLRDFIIDICNSTLSLRMLDLSRNGIDDSITSAFHESIWMPSLSRKLPNLNLSYNSISVRESQTIFKLHQSSGSPTQLSLLPYTPESYVLVEKTSSMRSDLLGARPLPPKVQITAPAAPPPQTTSLSAEESALAGLLASNPSAAPRWLLNSLGDALQQAKTDTQQVVTVNKPVTSSVREYVNTQLLSPPTPSWREFSAVLAIVKLLGYSLDSQEKAAVIRARGEAARVVQLVGDLLNLKVTDLSVLEQTVQDALLLELEGGAIDLLKLLYHRTLEQVEKSVVQGLEPDLIELALLKSEPFPIQTQNQAYQKELPNSTWGWLGLGEEYMDYERLACLSRSDLIASLDSRSEEYQDRKSQMLALRRSTFMLTENSSSLYPYYKIDSLLCISRNICRFRWSLTSKPSMRVDSARLAPEDPIAEFLTKQAEKNYKDDTEFKSCLKFLLKDARAIKTEEIHSIKQLKPHDIAECLKVVHEGFGTKLELPKYTLDTRLNEFLPELNQADTELLQKVFVTKHPDSWSLKSLSDWFETDYPIFLSSIQNGLKSTKELIALKLILRLALFLSLSEDKEPSSSLTTSIVLLSESIHVEIILECIRFAAIHKTKSLPLVDKILDALLAKEIPQPLAYVLLSLSSTLPPILAGKVTLVAYKTLFYPEIPTSLLKLEGNQGKPGVVGYTASPYTSYFIATADKPMIPLRSCTPKQLVAALGTELKEKRRVFTLEYLLQQPEPSISVTESQMSRPSSLDLPGTHYKFTWRGFWLDGAACPAEGILSITCSGVFLSSVDADNHRTVAMQIPYSQIIDLKFDLQQLVLVVDIEDSNPKHISLQVDCGLQISQDIVSYLVLQLRRPRKVAWAWNFLTTRNPLKALLTVLNQPQLAFVPERGLSQAEAECWQVIQKYKTSGECKEADDQPLAHCEQFAASIDWDKFECNSHGSFAYILEEHLNQTNKNSDQGTTSSENSEDEQSGEHKDQADSPEPLIKKVALVPPLKLDAGTNHLTPRRSSARRGSRLDNLLLVNGEQPDSVTRSINKQELEATLGEDSKSLRKLVTDTQVSTRTLEEASALKSVHGLTTVVEQELVGKTNTEVMTSSISNALKSFPGKKKKPVDS